jgi:glucose-6-phosphate 1-epimerase
MMLKVSNPGPGAFRFAAALHTYLRVDNLQQVAVHGLQGLRFSDSANGEKESSQSEELLTFPGEIDRIYFNVPGPVEIRAREPHAYQTMRVEQSGFTDVVTWNPGPEKGAALKDMEPDGYLNFVCIEAGLIEKPVTLAAGESWTGTQILVV